MNYQLSDVLLRRPEPKDIDFLYEQKNDPEVAQFLGRFTTGYSRADLVEWLDHHRRQQNELLWVIADLKDDHCLGHVGFYGIDHRIRSADFGIMLGDKSRQGHGIGKAVSNFTVSYGFAELNLNRIALVVLADNARARHLFLSVGFCEEGVLRQALFKGGVYHDLVLMAIMREEYDARRH